MDSCHQFLARFNVSLVGLECVWSTLSEESLCIVLESVYVSCIFLTKLFLIQCRARNMVAAQQICSFSHNSVGIKAIKAITPACVSNIASWETYIAVVTWVMELLHCGV